MEVVVPAAGLSTRFPGERPKYLLYDYKNELMLKNAVRPYIEQGLKITIAILREHETKFDASKHIFNAIPKAKVLILEQPTKGPAHTVYALTQHVEGPFLVKDCDSFFEFDSIDDNVNFICTSNIKDHDVLNKLASKSFVRYNEQGVILDVVEKEIVSDTFCVGGYKFVSPEAYRAAYEKLESVMTSEIYVSHVIQYMLNEKQESFLSVPVKNYVDVGTGVEWQKFNDRPVIFCDIDGTLIVAQSRFGSNSYASLPKVLPENYALIKRHYDSGSQIIFVTAREPQYRLDTIKMLESLGFNDCLLIMGVNNSKRILINDYNNANPWPRAIAYNIERNHDNLKDYME